MTPPAPADPLPVRPALAAFVLEVEAKVRPKDVAHGAALADVPLAAAVAGLRDHLAKALARLDAGADPAQLVRDTCDVAAYGAMILPHVPPEARPSAAQPVGALADAFDLGGTFARTTSAHRMIAGHAHAGRLPAGDAERLHALAQEADRLAIGVLDAHHARAEAERTCQLAEAVVAAARTCVQKYAWPRRLWHDATSEGARQGLTRALDAYDAVDDAVGGAPRALARRPRAPGERSAAGRRST